MAATNGNGKQKAAHNRSSDGEPLTFDERLAAKRIGVSDRTIRRYRKKSEIPFFRIGSRILYDESCIQEFLAKRRQQAAA